MSALDTEMGFALYYLRLGMPRKTSRKKDGHAFPAAADQSSQSRPRSRPSRHDLREGVDESSWPGRKPVVEDASLSSAHKGNLEAPSTEYDPLSAHERDDEHNNASPIPACDKEGNHGDGSQPPEMLEDLKNDLNPYQSTNMAETSKIDGMRAVDRPPPQGHSSGPSTNEVHPKGLTKAYAAGEDEESAAKRWQLPISPEPVQHADDTLSGLGQEDETFLLDLPGVGVQRFKYPSGRPFSTAHHKLEALSRLVHSADMDPQFTCAKWKYMLSDEGRRSAEKAIRDSRMVVVTGYEGEDSVCGWDEVLKLGEPDDILTTEYAFHAAGKLEPDCSITLQDLDEYGAEGSPLWGSTSLPFSVQTQPPLLEFLADDYLSWNANGTEQPGPQNARPNSFTTFNCHHILQRETFGPILQEKTGKTKVSLQRCGHRIVFWCKVTAEWTKLHGQEYTDMVWRMEDLERMGEWYCVLLRPGDMLIQPPGVIHINYILDNNILRVSQFLTYHNVPLFEAHRRAQSAKEPWTPKFSSMSVLRTMYRMAISLEARRLDEDISEEAFLSLARMVLRPAEYLPSVGAEDPATRKRMHAVQRRFLFLLRNPDSAASGERRT